MNPQIALLYIAVGSTSRLLTMRRFSPGARVSSVLTVIFMGVVIAYVLPYLPDTAASGAAAAIGMIYGGDIIGEWLGRQIDGLRVRRYVNGYTYERGWKDG